MELHNQNSDLIRERIVNSDNLQTGAKPTLDRAEKYPSAQTVLDYWKALTFYSAQHEELVKQALDNHFKINNEFIVEKHIKAYIAQKL